jgi:hypothetical protein
MKVTVDARAFVQRALEVNAVGKETPKAIARAVNRAGDMALTQVRRQLARQTGIRQGDMSRSRGLAKRLARPEKLDYAIVAQSKWTPLSYFGPRDVGPRSKWGRKAGGVGGTVSRAWGGTFTKHTWTMTVGAHVGVWKRWGRERRQRISPTTGKRYWSQGGIKEVWGPSLAAELIRDDTPKVFHDTMAAVVPNRLNHEVQRILDQSLKRRRP